MRRPSRALPGLLAAALCACGGDRAAVTVQMTLDPDTCGVDEPGAIEIHCAATAGVWLRGGTAGDYLGSACLDFGAAETLTLARLPSLLAGVDLSTSSTDPVWVEVAVYGGWSESQGCVAPDDFAGPAGAPQIIVRGRSDPAPLSESGGAIQVVLTCESIVTAPELQECLSECGEVQGECLGAIHIEECDSAAEGCFATCQDPACEDACEATYRACLAGSPDGGCELDFQDCADGCGIADDPCLDVCDAGFDTCLAEACTGAFQECADACTGGPVCAGVAVE